MFLPICLVVLFTVYIVQGALDHDTFVGTMRLNDANMNAADNSEECPLIQVYIQGMGVGIYAGRDFDVGTEVETVLGIPILKMVHADNILDNYVEGSVLEGHNMITFGYAMLYNHAPNGFYTLTKHMAPNETLHYITPFIEDRSELAVTYVANTKIFKYDQMFNFYGDTWFSSPERGIERIPCHDDESSPEVCRVNSFDLTSSATSGGITRIPGCPSAFAVMGHGRLFAAKGGIKSGTIIEVARGLLLPLESIQNTRDMQAFMWYKRAPGAEQGQDIKQPESVQGLPDHTLVGEILRRGLILVYNDAGATIVESNPTEPLALFEDTALLLLGWGSFFSPNRTGVANVDYERWKLSKSTPVEGDDCTRLQTMWVSFTANRDIVEGEELTVFLEEADVPSKYGAGKDALLSHRRIAGNQAFEGCV